MRSKLLKASIFLCLFSVANLVSAAIGGKEKNKKIGGSKTTAISTRAQLGKISLHSGYEFKSGKMLSFSTEKKFVSVNNYSIAKFGNKTVVTATRHQMLKPVISLQNNSSTVEVKLLKLRLN